MADVSVLPTDPASAAPAAGVDARAEPGVAAGRIHTPGPAIRVDVCDAGTLRRTVRVAAIVPCFNRPGDARALLADLAAIDVAGIDLRIVLVDNASTVPLSEVPMPPGLSVEHLRLEVNTGGSGGYNAGMARALGLDSEPPVGRPPKRAGFSASDRWRDFDADYLWLVDSDARVLPDTLAGLLAAMEQDERMVAAGPALADPATGRVFELGGWVNRRTGVFEPMVGGGAGVGRFGRGMPDAGCEQPAGASTSYIECDYVAACCVLVRADAVRAGGLMPDTFINGDDVEWFIRLGRRTGGRVVAIPGVRAFHPRFDRFPTWTRYYTTRNAHGPIDALGLGRRVKMRRAVRDVCRAVQQEMMGRADLARLHLTGLAHAAKGRSIGAAPRDLLEAEAGKPLAELAPVLARMLGSPRGRTVATHPDCGFTASDQASVERTLRNAGFRPVAWPSSGLRCRWLARWLLGSGIDAAIVPARGRPDSWFAGRVLVQVSGGAFVARRAGRVIAPLRAALAGAGGLARAARTAMRTASAPTHLDPAYRAVHAGAGRKLSVEAIVLSYNRWPALEATIERVLAGPAFDGGASDPGVPRTVTIVDNGSRDGTAERIEMLLAPRGVRFVRLDANLGVDAFNRGVAQSSAEAVLILDDDAIPEDDALLVAIDQLASRPELGAVTLHPRHPRTGASEWPFSARLHGAPHDRWPVMGCANLVRTSAWREVGGYEAAYFLYRNDADLALKLLGRGWGVRFDPALVAWHDTPAGHGARKSKRWHELATRNWIWMARRHGNIGRALAGGLMGWAWAHKLAGLSVSRHTATLRGAWNGWLSKAPNIGRNASSEGFARLLRLQLGRRA